MNRYGITWVNPNIKYNKIIYELMPIEAESTYRGIMDMLLKKGLRGATIEELFDWEGWDKKDCIIAPATIIDLDKEKFMPCVHCVSVCSPENSIIGDLKTKCWDEKRLAMVNIELILKPPFTILGVREI